LTIDLTRDFIRFLYSQLYLQVSTQMYIDRDRSSQIVYDENNSVS